MQQRSADDRLSDIEAKLDRVLRLVDQLEQLLAAARTGGVAKLLAALRKSGSVS